MQEIYIDLYITRIFITDMRAKQTNQIKTACIVFYVLNLGIQLDSYQMHHVVR